MASVISEISVEPDERLAHVTRAEFGSTWLASPIAVLDAESPIGMIRAGEPRRVLEVVTNLKSPGIS